MATGTSGDVFEVLVIQAPPRHGKSEYTGFWLPTWAAMVRGLKVIMCSYGQTQAREYGRRAMEVATLYGRNWNAAPVAGLESMRDWGLTNGGSMLSAGTGGPIMGRGADVLVVDDYFKSAQEAMTESVRNRLWDWWQASSKNRLEPGGVAIVVATRWHPDDLIGRLLKQEEEGAVKVHLHNYPAIDDAGEALWPERWPLPLLLQRKRSMDPAWWESLYQQRPARGGRTMWPDTYFGPEIWMKGAMPLGHTAMAIDSAMGTKSRSDYSAMVSVTLADGTLWVDADIKRRPVEQMARDLLAMVDAYGHNMRAVGIEANGWQALVAKQIDVVIDKRQRVPIPIEPIINTAHKIARIERLGSYLSRGKLRFRDTPDNHLLVDQLQDFPHGKHDDGCFVAGTMVETDNGPMPIERIKAGDSVLTRLGYRRVAIAGCTGTKATLKMTLTDGRVLTGTGNHPIMTHGGWCRMQSVGHGEMVICREPTQQQSQRLSFSTGSRSGGIQRPSSGRTEATTRHTLDTAGEVSGPCTKSYGSPSTDRYQKDMRSTTGTEIHSTTPQVTWSAYQQARTGTTIGQGTISEVQPLNDGHSSGPWPTWQQSGIGRKLAGSGIASTPEIYGPSGLVQTSSAQSATPPTARLSHTGLSSALPDADSGPMPRTVAMRVESVSEAGEQQVYNLTVEGTSEYFANGILVHNCDALEMAIRMLDWSLTSKNTSAGPTRVRA